MITFQPFGARRSLALASLGIAAAVACTEPPAGPEPLLLQHRVAPPVTEPAAIAWQRFASVLVVRNRLGAPTATRVAALLGLAQYAAVADGRAGRRELAVHHDKLAERGVANAHPFDRGAIAGASAEMLAFLFPTEANAIAAMLLEQEVMEVGNARSRFTRAEPRGRERATPLIERARRDRFDAPWTGTVPKGDPRAWVSSAAPVAFPTLGQMLPFLLLAGDQFRPDAPPSASSSTYRDDLAEVRRISDARSDEQIRIAQFWAMSTGTSAPAGYWANRAAGLIVNAGMNDRAAAHVFALLGAAEMDALIGCWDAKYTYWLWRPKHADPAITFAPGLAMPNHPSYPSGHSCGSAAAGEILAAVFPSAASALRAEVIEAGRSRVYAGIHFQFDCDVGQALGRAVAEYTLRADRAQGILAALR